MSTANKSRKPSNHLITSNIHPYTLWIAGIFITGFFFIAPFFKGLFNGATRSNLQGFVFNQPIYTAMIITFMTALLFGITLFFRTNRNILSKPQFIAQIGVWFIPLSFVLAYLISAVAKVQTLHAIVIYCMYALIFMMATYLSRNDKGLAWILGVIVASSYLIVLFGITNLFTGPFYPDAVRLEPGRLRLTSVFQYANTYAAFLNAVLLSAIYLVTHAKHKWLQISSALMIMPIFLSLFLTYSRGGLVLLPVAAFLLLFVLRFSKQILFLIYLVISGALSILLLSPLSSIGQKQFHAFTFWNLALGLGLIIGVSLLFAGMAHMLQHRFSNWLETKCTSINQSFWSRLYIPISGVILAGLTALILLGTNVSKILPENLQHRIKNLTLDSHSVLERATFYRDSMKMIGDYPIFGTGAAGWSILYEKYQNNPYTSTQTHSFFIQHWIETGLIGLIILLLFLGYVYWLYLRMLFRRDSSSNTTYSVIFAITATSILIHSLIDFNMSYVYIGSLVFLCLGVMTGQSSTKGEPERAAKKKISFSEWIKPAFVVLLSLVLFITSIRWLSASNHYVTAIKNTKSGNFHAIIEPLDKAIHTFPHPDYLGYKARILLDAYRQTEDEYFDELFIETTERLLEVDPYNKLGMQAKVEFFVFKDDLYSAASVLEKMLDLAPWDLNLYDSIIPIYTQLANNHLSEANNPYIDKAFDYYNEMLVRLELLDQLPENQLPGRDFYITPNIAVNIGQLYLYEGKFEEAANLFSSTLDDKNRLDETSKRVLTRYYLASLILLGRDDQELYDSFIAQDQDEQAAIEEIVTMYTRQ